MVAHMRQDQSQGISQRRAPSMPHMHRTRRIGRHKLDEDLLVMLLGLTAIGLPLLENRLHFVLPAGALQRYIEKTRSSDRDGLDHRVGTLPLQMALQFLGN